MHKWLGAIVVLLTPGPFHDFVLVMVGHFWHISGSMADSLVVLTFDNAIDFGDVEVIQFDIES